MNKPTENTQATANRRRTAKLVGNDGATETGEHFVDIGFYKQQRDFVDSQTFISGFCAGRGSGKTWVAAAKMYLRAKTSRYYVVVAPDETVGFATAWRTFLEVGELFGTILAVRKSAKPPEIIIRTMDGGTATIQFRSGHDPENLRGPNLSGVLLEEASIMHPSVLQIVMACLREGGELGWLDMVFTPKGKLHWTYGVFFDEEGEPLPDVHLSRARTEDNPFNDPLFAKNLRRQYTSAFALQELDGEFTDLTGLMFHREWFSECHPEDVPFHAKRIRFWDKAATPGGGDYSAGVLMAFYQGTYYVEDVVRGQWSPGERNDIMRRTAERDKARYRGTVKIYIEQEPGSGGKESAILSIQQLAGFPVWAKPASGVQHRMKDKIRIPGAAKIVRAHPFASQAEHGNVKVVLGRWNRDWYDEMLAFPEATNDDQVDATSGAFTELAKREPGTRDTPGVVRPDVYTPRSVQIDRGFGSGRSGVR